LHKTSDTAWTAAELSPLKHVEIMDVTSTSSVLGAEITLADGTKHVIDFKDIDGLKSC
jgi:hypothetical protein